MKRCRLKRNNFQIRNKMIKENKTSDKQQNGNDFIADVTRSCSSEDIFREKQLQMTNKELADLVCEETTKMCRTGGKSFTMRVPVNVKDTDMLISELVRRFRVLSNCG